MKDALIQVRLIGGLGLHYLGVPAVSEDRSWADPDLFTAIWRLDRMGDGVCYASLYAELWVLQAWGLLDIWNIKQAAYYAWCNFKYTEAGAREVLAARSY